jgi:hypothetical protein
MTRVRITARSSSEAYGDGAKEDGKDPTHAEDDDPRYLIPEGLGGVKAHHLELVFVDEPDDQRSSR